MKNNIIVFTFVLISSLLPNLSYAQFQNILIDSINGPNEPSIAINPKNVNELVAGSNLDNEYYSHDGGFSWTKQTLFTPWGVWGDPCIITDTSGRFYYFHLSYGPSSNGYIDRIICQRSDDAGVNWTVASHTGFNDPKDQDKAWAVYDGNPISAYKGNLYVTWTEFDEYANPFPGNESRILFSKSVNHGVSWSSPITISQFSGDCIDEDNTAEGAVPAIGPNGEIYVTWSLNDTLYFDRSLDGGVTWLATDLVSAVQPFGWTYDVPGIYRANGLPITACDLSGGNYHGTIYVNFSDQRNGNTDTDIWLVKSTDGGNTWSPAIRVNDDAVGHQNFFTWMTIDQATGILYFVFYDRRNYTGTRETDVYMAYSVDGGTTFTNVLVSDSGFTPDSAAFFGDYTNITAHDGHIRPIWTRLDSLSLSVWTAIIDIPTGIADGNYFGLNSSIKNFPNPFADETSISFTSSRNQELSLDVVDIFGKKVASIFANKMFSQGSYKFNFDRKMADLSPGVYLVRLSNGRYSETSRMIVLEE